MKASRRVGVLGMTDEERAELWRTKKWPARQVEAPESALGLSLSLEELPANADDDGAIIPLSEVLLLLWEHYLKRPKPGRKSKANDDFVLGCQCFETAGGHAEKARRLFAKQVRPRVDYPIASKRFTKHFLKKARKLGILKPKA